MSRLNDFQKEAILRLRRQGCGYKAIAEQLALPRDTVRSCCKRSTPAGMCKNCGAPIQQMSGRKTKLFCSASCRRAWWNSHPGAVNQRAIYSFTCPNCGKEFTAYGNANRKYCSHACYIASRFQAKPAIFYERIMKEES